MGIMTYGSENGVGIITYGSKNGMGIMTYGSENGMGIITWYSQITADASHVSFLSFRFSHRLFGSIHSALIGP